MTEDDYYAWFAACGFTRTGVNTALTEDMLNDKGKLITVPRASVLSAADRKEAAEGMSKYFGWKSAWGVH